MVRSGWRLILAVTSFVTAPACAGDSPFGWLYPADVHPAGTREIEQHIDQQRTQSQGFYRNTLSRTEFEFGVTPRYQTSVYLNARAIDAFRNGADGTTGGPNTDISDRFDQNSHYRLRRLESVSWENIYQVYNPLVDPIGVALYAEPSWGPRNKELELRLILQKNLLDDRLILLSNIETDLERNNRGDDIEKATELNVQFGASYRFANNWSAGLELRNHREYEGYGYAKPQHSAWFFGPNLHYAAQRWWMTVAFRHQLKHAAGFTDEQREVIRDHRIFGDEHTLNQFIVKVGFPF